MGVRQVKVSVHDLEIGMYVADLDRPWHETPFPIQGFPIRTQAQINQLASCCRWVMVDEAEVRGRVAVNQRASAPARSLRRAEEETFEIPPIHLRKSIKYARTESLKKELKHCRKILPQIEKTIEASLAELMSSGHLDHQAVEWAANQLTDSVVRNPDAVLWLTRISREDSESYRHSLDTAIWALVCGRHMGLEQELLRSLATGCLLSQVGKLRLDPALRVPEKSIPAEQWKPYQEYVLSGVDMLMSAQVSKAVVSTVGFHRERHNGSGFPQRCKGDKIPLLAKIAGIADAYERLLMEGLGERMLTPAEAISELYESRNKAFQADLVEKFIQAIGVYPTGTMVELSNRQQAIVLAHVPERRLLPEVILLTDEQHRPLKRQQVLNLSEYNEDKGAGDALVVKACLPRSAIASAPEIQENFGRGEGLRRLTRLMAG